MTNWLNSLTLLTLWNFGGKMHLAHSVSIWAYTALRCINTLPKRMKCSVPYLLLPSTYGLPQPALIKVLWFGLGIVRVLMTWKWLLSHPIWQSRTTLLLISLSVLLYKKPTMLLPVLPTLPMYFMTSYKLSVVVIMLSLEALSYFYARTVSILILNALILVFLLYFAAQIVSIVLPQFISHLLIPTMLSNNAMVASLPLF